MATSASGIVHVDVKWQKEAFPQLQIDLSQPPAVFKSQLFSLTGVAPERQKIMGFKGGLLKDDADWTAVGARDGLKITMIGTADKVPEAPQQATFVEDLPEEQQDTTGLSKYGAGLENLGNTCYMNSTVQCLYAVPELRASLAAFQSPISAPEALLTAAARSLFGRMDKAGQAIPPMEFLMALRRAFPQFDQRAREGAHMQQDAEECWGALLTAFKGQLKLPSNGQSTEQAPAIRELFGVRTRATLKCDESDETTEYSEVELMMKCNINAEVNHLAEGLKLGLRGDREKTSAALGRLAHFRGEARIEALPPYLTIQMVRFFYKADVQQKAKILRKVTFPLVLDVYEFCSDELKATLEGPRLAQKGADDARAMASKRPKLGMQGSHANSDDKAALPPSAEENVGSNTTGRGVVTGRYDLIGILTHKGRSADSGHYVSWVKQTDGQWIQFDDDNMIPRKEEEVLALSGGGDWHMAYLLLYKAQLVQVPNKETKTEDVVADMAMAEAEAK